MTLYQCLNDVVFAKYIIITFSIVNYPYPCHSCMFITENCSSKFTIMSFWAPAPKSPSNNGIPKKSLDMSLRIFFHFGPFFALLTPPPLPPLTTQSYDVWLLRYRAQQTKFFVILDHFLHFYPSNNPKNQNFETLNKNN